MGHDHTPPHYWFSPSDCAALLDASKHGEQWRAACPAHHGDNRQSLTIAEGTDSFGHPMTLLHCFAHNCPVQDICAAMGIHLRNLFSIHPQYAKATRNQPRAHSPRVERLKHAHAGYTSDEIAQLLLEEMIVSDPQWIQECAPARAKMWELALASTDARSAFNKALRLAHIPIDLFWRDLTHEQEP